ncbi:Serine protease gd [Eumeta japonica]|uniref:Serine protease gd n=1 Tax=Eumeta variegata TaxID=151549 RepID=A0A4C1VKN2_EUMVA|nr:Serine protease gd [Eumeta japonica]
MCFFDGLLDIPEDALARFGAAEEVMCDADREMSYKNRFRRMEVYEEAHEEFFQQIYNDKMTTCVNFNLYPDLLEAELKIVFEDPVKLISTSQNDNIKTNATRVLILKTEDSIPKHFYFHIKIVKNNSIPTIKTLSLNGKELCNEREKESLTIQALELTSPNETTSKHVCGRRTLEHTELMITGGEASLGDWPWHVALYIKDVSENKARYRCGGSIVSHTAILSAGHCLNFDGNVIEAQRVFAFAGAVNLKQLNKSTTQRLKAEKIIFHPSYKEEEATSDLLIVKVNKFTFNEYVQPICLWGPLFEKTELYGLRGMVIGFGMTENRTYSDVLRSTQIEVQRDEKCIAYSPGIYTSLLTEFSFCTGYGPKSGINVLNGDSGGGFMLPVQQPDHKISWLLRGVLSKCGRPLNETLCHEKFYTVYTDVAPHYSWILHHSGLKFTSNIL